MAEIQIRKLVTLVEDPMQLETALESPAERVALKIEPDRRLVADLRGYLDGRPERIGVPSR